MPRGPAGDERGPVPRPSRYTGAVSSFRDRLGRTLRALEPVLAVPGVLVVGSEVPNLLEPDAATTLVVSEDVDIAVPLAVHADVKAALSRVTALVPSSSEPSVWVPRGSDCIEANFLGMEPGRPRIGEAWVHEDSELPLLVFGTLGVIEPGARREAFGASIPLPTPASLAVEKLLTDRSGIKYDRDLCVVLGLLLTWSREDECAFLRAATALAAPDRWTLRSNLTALSLLPDREGMPPVSRHRDKIAALLSRVEGA